MNTSKFRFAIGLSGLLLLAPVADAQRVNVGGFQGFWKGTLTMDVILDVPPEEIERLSKPVELEIRIFRQGGAELYFYFEEDEWDFIKRDAVDSDREQRFTPIGEQNGVITAQLPGVVDWFSTITLNLALQGEDALFLSWSRLTIRNGYLHDGMDEYGFAGVAVLNRIDE